MKIYVQNNRYVVYWWKGIEVIKVILGESLGDYLETLLVLDNENGKIRRVDAAKKMDVFKPSVNKAMNVLREKGLVQQETYGDIHFTPEERELAAKVYQRHMIIRSFLEGVLGVAPDTAEEGACHIEHVISEDIFQKIKNFKR